MEASKKVKRKKKVTNRARVEWIHIRHYSKSQKEEIGSTDFQDFTVNTKFEFREFNSYSFRGTRNHVIKKYLLERKRAYCRDLKRYLDAKKNLNVTFGNLPFCET